jgi:hypothetical protein
MIGLRYSSLRYSKTDRLWAYAGKHYKIGTQSTEQEHKNQVVESQCRKGHLGSHENAEDRTCTAAAGAKGHLITSYALIGKGKGQVTITIPT